jgi:hypothetical protein
MYLVADFDSEKQLMACVAKFWYDNRTKGFTNSSRKITDLFFFPSSINLMLSNLACVQHTNAMQGEEDLLGRPLAMEEQLKVKASLYLYLLFRFCRLGLNFHDLLLV